MNDAQAPADSIAKIDELLETLADTRASVRHLCRVTTDESRTVEFPQIFNERLRTVKGVLGRLGTEVDGAQGILEYAHNISAAKTFNIDSIVREESNDVMDFLNDDLQGNEIGDTNKEFGSALKQNASFLLREITIATKYTLKRVNEISEDRDPKRLDTKGKDTSSESGMITAFINDWIKTSSLSKHTIIQYAVEESNTLTGSACCLEISIPHVMKAYLSIQHDIEKDGVVFDNFCIVAYREEKPLWERSDYSVFSKINILALERLDEIAKKSSQKAIYCVLNWIASYHDLFTATCHKCQKRLLFNSPQFKYMPPTLRILKSSEDHDEQIRYLAYHDKCI
ncbi:hypothetical protein INT43_000294 [Umbelopsis isabellina]|uniref:Mediator of RNA polymerase II transcription subunit 27 n=1 Tax=Mortierella isabellina TaxID=91625 RepID=A0A8H7UII7_MORIS|nr:hypothetical protein INT43_000294 [Umbelopsis isabellina]